MQYYKISTGKFIEYDEATSFARIIIKSDLQAQKQELQDRIGAIDPEQPTTNAGWITWGKEHYPKVDHSQEIAELDRINSVLDAIKNL